jgi:tRNA 2-selenouridine synthase
LYQEIDTEKMFELRQTLPVVDVRSPGEFLQGHIPRAHNIFLFDNDQRAQVGTCYKRSGRAAAVLLGMELIGPQIAQKVRQAMDLDSSKIIVHCWRGGMRSSSMALFFHFAGLQCYVLKGGHKAYRAYIRQRFGLKAPLIVLGGMTGSGKTEYLRGLQSRGLQILDLEGLANHKGSAFGSIGQEGEQPSNEQFENNLAEEWRQLDFTKPIIVEDESKAIGKVGIPDPLFLQIRSSPVIKLEISREERIKRLVEEYTGSDLQSLKESTLKISERLGGLNTKMIIEAIETQNYTTATDLLLNYYDKTYDHGLSKRSHGVYPLALNEVRMDRRLDKIAAMIDDLFAEIETVGP